jgi:hypothetical protein
MKILKILALVFIFAAVAVALAAPIRPVPGFFIGGDPTPVPAKYQPDYPEIIAGVPKVEEARDTVAVLRLNRG